MSPSGTPPRRRRPDDVPDKDYSHVPLSRKLGIREGSLVVLLGAPDGAEGWLEPLPLGVEVTRDPAEVAGGEADVIVCFATGAAELGAAVARLVPLLSVAGGLWLCSPKRASQVPTDLTFDVVQRIGLDAGLVDNKVASVSAVWSGVRFVRRLRDRPGRVARAAR
jgi:hypothetical protein